MGVIHVVHEAQKRGFVNGHPDWCNLGQGQPEVGELRGAPPRLLEVRWDPADQAYGPLEGTPELRERIAEHYNRLYRRDRSSRYGPANVAVAAGGRLALTRAMAALGRIAVGYQVPDYTAYEDMLETHLARITPVALRGREANGFALTPGELETAATQHGLGAFVFSNPCNPTGNVIAGAELEAYVDLARELDMALVSDEFYSHFVYEDAGPAGVRPAPGPVSAARHVRDVERDPVLIVDGLTKSFRYPGWRLGWVVGPAHMVETLARTASAIDGGPSRIVQRAALEALAPGRADQETSAVRAAFADKCSLMVERLERMGVRLAAKPRGTFYCWGSLAGLRPPFDSGVEFFQRALERRVMTVPGEFFDVDPGRRRRGASPFRSWMRFSFGPPRDNLELGLDRLEALLASA